MERHVQTILQVIATAAILGLASFAWEAQRTFGRLDQQLDSIARDLNRLGGSVEQLASTAETKADHERDMLLLDAKLVDHEDRIRRIEQPPQ